MMDDISHQTVALIDGDNISWRHARQLVSIVTRHPGRSLFVVFAGTSNEQPAAIWGRALMEAGVAEVQLYGSIPGNNGADMTMTIVAMDLLHETDINNFLIVTNDSDLVPLARRLDESRKSVSLVGCENASVRLRQACERFFELDSKSRDVQSDRSLKCKIEPAVVVLRRAIVDCARPDGWASLAVLGAHLMTISKQYRQNRFGFASLSNLLRSGPFVLNCVSGTPVAVRLATNRSCGDERRQTLFPGEVADRIA